MFPFPRKQKSNYVAPKVFVDDEVKSLDTGASEPRSLNRNWSLPIMPDQGIMEQSDAETLTQVVGLVSQCPVAQRCVDIRADGISSVLVKVEGGEQGKLLMESPNARDRTLPQASYIWTNDLTYAGEVNLQLDMSIRGRPQLWRARPDVLITDAVARIITYDEGILTAKPNPTFRWFFDASWVCTGAQKMVGGVWVPHESRLIRIRHHNPVSDISGAGSVRSVVKSIRTWLEVQNLIATNSKRGGPRHAASIADFYDNEQWATIRTQMAAASGDKGLTVLPAGANLTAIGESFSQMGVVDIKEALEREITQGLAIQPVLVGMKDENDFAALRGAQRIFYKTWIKPEAEWLYEALQSALRIHLKEPALTITIDDANLVFTEDDRIERAKTKKDLGVFTTNEIRRELGAEDIAGGDVLPGVAATPANPNTALAAREADRLLGTQTDAERALDAVTKPREVALNANTEMRASEKVFKLNT